MNTASDARIDARKDLSSTIAEALRAEGFLTTQGTSGRLHVAGTTGHLAILDFWRVHVDSTGRAYGHVTLTPRLRTYSKGLYKLGLDGTINLTGLVRRLTAEGPKVQAAIAAQKAVAERDRADDAIRATLDVPADLDVMVYEGLVDIKLVNLTPAQAQAVLAALKAS